MTTDESSEQKVMMLRLRGMQFDIICLATPSDLLKCDGRIEISRPMYIKMKQIDEKSASAEIGFIPMISPFCDSKAKSLQVQACDVLYSYPVNDSMEREFRSSITGLKLPHSGLAIPGSQP